MRVCHRPRRSISPTPKPGACALPCAFPAPPRPPWTPPADSGPRIRDLGRPLLVRDIWRDQARHAHVGQLARARAARCLADEARERAKSQDLARRFEALKRAVANPVPYARRLLLKLKAQKNAYDAAMRVAMRAPPRKQLNPMVFARAEFEACSIVPAVLAPALNQSSAHLAAPLRGGAGVGVTARPSGEAAARTHLHLLPARGRRAARL